MHEFLHRFPNFSHELLQKYLLEFLQRIFKELSSYILLGNHQESLQRFSGNSLKFPHEQFVGIFPAIILDNSNEILLKVHPWIYQKKIFFQKLLHYFIKGIIRTFFSNFFRHSTGDPSRDPSELIPCHLWSMFQEFIFCSIWRDFFRSSRYFFGNSCKNTFPSDNLSLFPWRILPGPWISKNSSWAKVYQGFLQKLIKGVS